MRLSSMFIISSTAPIIAPKNTLDANLEPSAAELQQRKFMTDIKENKVEEISKPPEASDNYLKKEKDPEDRIGTRIDISV